MKREDLFLSQLDRQDASKRLVKKWWERQGYRVAWVPTRIRPDSVDRFLFSDKMDLEIESKWGNEVKHRTNIDFRDADSYPYPTVFICEDYRLKEQSTVRFWSIVSSDLKAMAMISFSTRQWWRLIEKYDHSQGRLCKFWTVPCDKVRWEPLSG